MNKVGAKAYLVNTGWNGSGKRISIKDTRGIDVYKRQHHRITRINTDCLRSSDNKELLAVLIRAIPVSYTHLICRNFLSNGISDAVEATQKYGSAFCFHTFELQY